MTRVGPSSRAPALASPGTEVVERGGLLLAWGDFVDARWKRHIVDKLLNRGVEDAVTAYKPPSAKGVGYRMRQTYLDGLVGYTGDIADVALLKGHESYRHLGFHTGNALQA